jgi:hypothetical protein
MPFFGTSRPPDRYPAGASLIFLFSSSATHESPLAIVVPNKLPCGSPVCEFGPELRPNTAPRHVCDLQAYKFGGRFFHTSTAEAIYEKAKTLSEQRQLDALEYVNFLLSQEEARVESQEWTTFSRDQLVKQYGTRDAVYDQD